MERTAATTTTKLSLFADDIVFYIKNGKESTKQKYPSPANETVKFISNNICTGAENQKTLTKKIKDLNK